MRSRWPTFPAAGCACKCRCRLRGSWRKYLLLSPSEAEAPVVCALLQSNLSAVQSATYGAVGGADLVLSSENETSGRALTRQPAPSRTAWRSCRFGHQECAVIERYAPLVPHTVLPAVRS